MDPNTLTLITYRIDIRVEDLKTLQDSELVEDHVGFEISQSMNK
jgi:hypothetical protein